MVGLKNQGATCYLNSLLQSLYFTNAFRKVGSFIFLEAMKQLRFVRQSTKFRPNKRTIELKALGLYKGFSTYYKLMRMQYQRKN